MSDRLSAMDVERQEFPRSLRGYSPDEVRLYLRAVAEHLERLNLDNDELRSENAALRGQIEEIRQREKTLQETLVSAQQMSDEMKERSKHEAELLVREARLRAGRMLEQAQDQLARIEAEMQRARLERDAFEARLKTAVEEHLALIEMRQKDRAEMDNLHFLHRKTGSEAG